MSRYIHLLINTVEKDLLRFTAEHFISTSVHVYDTMIDNVSVHASLESCMRALLVATTNRHKLEELQTIFSDLPYQLLSLHDLHIDLDVEETGTTFQENSALKALTYARISGVLTLADDSGLEIDALGGEPGVYSARFAGRNTPYEERFRIIYERLHAQKELSPAPWTARFRCVMTIAEANGYHQSVDGALEGYVADAPRGEHGFGYDPIVYVPEFGKTCAELEPAIKNQISHRGVAARHARALLESWPQSSSSHV